MKEGYTHLMTQYAGRIKKALSRTQHSIYTQTLQIESGITLTFTDLGNMRCRIKLAKSSSRIVSQDRRYTDITEQQLQTIFNAISQAGGSDYVKDEADTKDITYTFAMKPIERIYN
jgi:hypothetical protein